MIRRVLLLSAAVVAAVLAQAPAAHADEICMLTVTLEGTIDQTYPVCFDYDHGQICDGSTIGHALQKVTYELCLPNPLVRPAA